MPLSVLRGRSAAVRFLLLFLAALVVVPSASGRTITGQVSSGNGPLDGAQVTAIDPDTKGLIATTTTANGGNYTLSVAAAPTLPSVILRFDGPPNAHLASEYYDDTQLRQDAVALDLAPSSAANGIDATLAPAVAVSGAVRVDGALAASGSVTAIRDGDGLRRFVEQIAGNGTYALDLEAGSWTLRFTAPGAVPTYLGGARTAASATRLVITTQPKTGIDIDLPKLGSVSGTATSAGQPAANVPVQLIPIAVDGENYPYLSGTLTDDQGKWSFRNLLPGTYKVQFQSNVDVEGEWYDDVDSASAATTISVDAGEDVVGIDAALRARGRINAQLRDAAGRNVPKATLIVARPDGTRAGEFYTAADGTVALKGLSAGTYVVRTFGIGATDEFPITIVDGTVQNGVIFMLTKKVDVVVDSRVTGKVIGPDGNPVKGTAVLWRAGGAYQGEVYSAADGTYEIRGLRAGSYQIAAFGIDAPAVDVTLDEGEVRGNVDFRAPLTLGTPIPTATPTPTPSATPTPTRTPAPTKAVPVVAFDAKRPSFSARSTRPSVRLTCRAARCEGRLTVRAGKKGALLATANYELAPSTERNVQLKLTANGRARLRTARGQLAVTLTATVEGGRTTTAAGTITPRKRSSPRDAAGRI